MSKLQSLFSTYFDESQVYFDVPMYKHTSFRIGGEAKVLYLPNSIEDIKKAIEISQKNSIPYYIIGNGTNLLVKDNGFDGVIIKIAKNMNSIKLVSDNKIYAQSGTSFSALSNFALKNSLKGLEFASGIPGTVGGAVTMNAGAHGGEIKDFVINVDILNSNNEFENKDCNDMGFVYRNSNVSKENYIVLGANFILEHGKYEDIMENMKQIILKRKNSQPLDMPSAGSTFKRPPNNFAGKLIMECGLAGYTIGGAKVSEKHCGFILNTGNAKAEDVLKLIDYIINKVEQKYNITLEPEIKIIGR